MSDKPKRLLIELADILDRAARAGLVISGSIEVIHPEVSKFVHSAEIIEEHGGRVGRLTVAAKLDKSIPAVATPRPSVQATVQTADVKALGYTGDLCDTCGSSAMVRNGTCLKCMDCGSTNGCS